MWEGLKGVGGDGDVQQGGKAPGALVGGGGGRIRESGDENIQKAPWLLYKLLYIIAHFPASSLPSNIWLSPSHTLTEGLTLAKASLTGKQHTLTTVGVGGDGTKSVTPPST